MSPQYIQLKKKNSLKRRVWWASKSQSNNYSLQTRQNNPKRAQSFQADKYIHAAGGWFHGDRRSCSRDPSGLSSIYLFICIIYNLYYKKQAALTLSRHNDQMVGGRGCARGWAGPHDFPLWASSIFYNKLINIKKERSPGKWKGSHRVGEGMCNLIKDL